MFTYYDVLYIIIFIIIVLYYKQIKLAVQNFKYIILHIIKVSILEFKPYTNNNTFVIIV